MRYLPHTQEDIQTMLQKIGVGSLEELFPTIPDDCRQKQELDIPGPLTEWELKDHINSLSADMGAAHAYKVYIGAGSYDHYIPSSIPALLSRSEFLTSYTPYQPEVSQGTLQGIYEYQTLVAGLLDMEVANASMYDGASALAEALLMAVRVSKKKGIKSIAISRAIHPAYRQVVKTYFGPTEYEVVELDYKQDGRTDVSGLSKIEGLGAVAIQSPNFFGCIEDLATAGVAIQEQKALFVSCFTEPLSFGVYKAPGQYGADIVCGEGQSLGIPQSFGGPGVGLFASKEKFARKMPGRLIGKTKDADGKRGFVLTLATREQHIRRDKATSNICSNESLCALSTAMYMASLGGTGFRELGQLNYDKTEYLKSQLQKAGVRLVFDSPTFNEFVVEFAPGFDATYQKLFAKNIVAGLCLDKFYPEMKNCYLLCVTETSTKEDLDVLVSEVSS